MHGVDRLFHELAKSRRGEYAVIPRMRDVDVENLLWTARARRHDRDPLAEKQCFFQVVRDEEDRHAILVVDLEQRFVHDRLRERIERAVRFVEQQNFRIVHQRPNDLDAASYAGRKLARIICFGAREPGVGHHVARFVFGVFSRQAPLHNRPESNVFENRLPWEERAVLKYHDAIRSGRCLRFSRAAEHLAVEIDRARRNAVKSGDRVEQRRLPAAGRSDDHADLAGSDVERAMIDRKYRRSTGIVNLHDILDANRAGAHAASDKASSRTRHCIMRLPNQRTRVLVAYPTRPSVIIPITIVGYFTSVYEFMIR